VATVIDQLIVRLGLDPRDFDRGAKQAAATLVNTEHAVRRGSEGMGRSLSGLAAKWLTVTAAIATVKKAVTIIDDAAERTRRLGIDSKNMGQATAAALRNFENTVETFGGSAEDARKSIAGMNKAVFDLAYNGQMSDGLVMLARLGVEFQEAGGEARDFKSIVLDTADAIGKAQAGGMSRANAFQYLQQSGFDSGMSEMILAGRAQVEAAMAAQERRRQVSGSDVDAATGIAQSRTGRRQAREGLEVAFMQSPAGKALESANQALEDLMSPGAAAAATAKVTGKVTDAMEGLADKTKQLGKAFDEFLVKHKPKGRAAYESVIQRAAANNKIPAHILAGVLATESNFDPAAVNAKSGARGIAQLMPQYFPNAGANPDDDIRTAAAYLADLEKQAGGDWVKALQMYNAGPSRVKNSADYGGTGSALKPETLDYAGKVLDYPMDAMPTPGAQSGATYNKTDVQIDSITIQTQAKDAEGVAESMDGAVKRKLLASHAEQGMQ
jgi:soluble lytic murein transglycosylase-like protein